MPCYDNTVNRTLSIINFQLKRRKKKLKMHVVSLIMVPRGRRLPYLSNINIIIVIIIILFAYRVDNKFIENAPLPPSPLTKPSIIYKYVPFLDFYEHFACKHNILSAILCIYI